MKPTKKHHSKPNRKRATKSNTALQKIDFTIDNMDVLGQGVHKDGRTITFIAKTLPGETGSARIHRRSKGVQFATLESIEQPADHRIEPECKHFQQCPGCHYLHTDYDHELDYKKAALTKIMQSFIQSKYLTPNTIETIAAPQRLAYRNRMQLHYRHKYIGLIDASSDQVVEIPNCKIIRPELQQQFNALYADKSWTDDYPGHGHCELYLNNSEVSQTWNSDYADGGFTQVNEAMNTILKGLIKAEVHSAKQTANGLLDLFSGNGNLSTDAVTATDSTPTIPRVMVDVAPENHRDYLQIDLFSDRALIQFKNKIKETQFDTMLVDPPRKGFPALNQWIKQCKPKQLIYVSCNAATMARDLRTLECKFKIDKVLLVDLFPSSYHFETVACISF